MRKAKVVVVRNSYKSSDAVSNVLRYMVNSPFSDTEEILSNHVRTDSIENMINDFEEGQKESDLEGHRRLFHYILTTRPSNVQQQVLYDGAENLCDYYEELGHRAVFVFHCGSEHNNTNMHCHVAVNPVSYKTGKRLYDKRETYNGMIRYLNEYSDNDWDWTVS